MAKDAYYFSHDSNARTDPKILALISDYGMAGYGMWWVLVEILREQNGYKIKHGKCTWKAIAMQMQSTADEVQKFITDCVGEYELLEQITEENGDRYIYSPSLARRMEKLDNIKAKRSQAANSMWNKKRENMQNDANAMQMQSNSMQSKPSKPSKVKEYSQQNKFADDSLPMVLALYLLEKIRQNNPKAKQPNLQSWCSDVDKIIRIDGYTEHEIKRVIDYSQEDKFWKANILSAGKLRDKIGTLTVQAGTKEVAKNTPGRPGMKRDEDWMT